MRLYEIKFRYVYMPVHMYINVITCVNMYMIVGNMILKELKKKMEQPAAYRYLYVYINIYIFYVYLYVFMYLYIYIYMYTYVNNVYIL
jgi:hypothetical protein